VELWRPVEKYILSAQIEVIGYLLCAAAFLPLGVLILLSRARTRYKYLILAGCGATILWSGMIGVAPWIRPTIFIVTLLEVARDVVWLSFITVLIATSLNRVRVRVGMIVAAISGAGLLALGTFFTTWISAPAGIQALTVKLSGGGHVLLAVLGLLLLENLYRNADEETRWSVKHICFGLGAVFAYDFFLYADAALFNRIDESLFRARGFVNILAVPLAAVSVSRARAWGMDLHVSREVVFHSAALVGTGLYLLVMAGAGYYIRQFGGEWGVVFQTIFLFGAFLILLILFSSQSLRAKIRVWISKHFFSYAYDYRQEWLRFTQTISLDEQGTSLHDRILHAVADIVGRTSGALWILHDNDRSFLPSAQWNFRGGFPEEILPAEPADSDFCTYLATSHWVVDLRQYADNPGHYGGLVLPNWLGNHPKADMVVPLIHRDALCAFLVLGAPRAYQPLDWETYDLLKAVGGQAASYLKEEQAANALSDARRLESFNQRFAFVIHDLKNLVGQMTLLLKNAERHGDDPEFQKDLLATVNNSVIRMRELLEKFKAEHGVEKQQDKPVPETVAEVPSGQSGLLSAMFAQIADTWRRQKPDLEVRASPVPDVLVDGTQLTSVIDHLLQNALDAAGEGGRVSLRLKGVGNEAVMEVEDNGPGMDAEFISQKLFRPLKSSKDGGYGLGAFQVRELVREMGGRLEVSSTPGKGTTMRVILPARLSA